MLKVLRIKAVFLGATTALISTPSFADWYATARTQSYVVDQSVGDVDHVGYACSAPGTYCEAPTPSGFIVDYAHDQTSGKVQASSLSEGVYPISGLGSTHLEASAQATADLSKGSVAISNGQTFGSATDYAASNTTAALYDTVQFSSGGTAPFDVGIDFWISGSTSDGAQTLASFYALPEFGGTGISLSEAFRPVYPGGSLEASDPTTVSLTGDFIQVSPGHFHGVITIDPTVNPEYSEFEISEGLFSESGVSDMSAKFSFDTPAGVTYTSDSERLLALPAAPEPATWAMMLAGFGFVGVFLRTRRNVVLPRLLGTLSN